MRLSQFTDLLRTNSDKLFHLTLPDHREVPIWFHITEVAYTTKKFIDCGGNLHSDRACQLQAWVWLDNEHSLRSGKMADIIDIAHKKGVLPAGEDLEIEIEYEDTATAQYKVESFEVTNGAVVFKLAARHTDCLAKDICVPTALTMAEPCCGGGCC